MIHRRGNAQSFNKELERDGVGTSDYKRRKRKFSEGFVFRLFAALVGIYLFFWVSRAQHRNTSSAMRNSLAEIEKIESKVVVNVVEDSEKQAELELADEETIEDSEKQEEAELADKETIEDSETQAEAEPAKMKGDRCSESHPKEWRGPNDEWKDVINDWPNLHRTVSEDRARCSLLPESKIPRVIYLNWKTKELFKEAKMIDDEWRHREPCFERRVVSDDECRDLAARVLMGETLDGSGQNRTFQQAFDDLPSNVMRADVCRYLTIYFNGGIYMDLDVRWAYSLKEWLHEDVEDRVMGVEALDHYCNWIFAAKPFDKCLGGIIDELKRTITQKGLFEMYHTYAHTVHAVTGPAVMGGGIRKACPSYKPQMTRDDINIKCVRHLYGSQIDAWQNSESGYKSWVKIRDEKLKQYAQLK
mmetsp:Transcript_34690/g.42414  ORF Transcript_34690/g.42414 Transcript_34690/m.42414 type:complete len:417 (+) Transcript_34690:95-1345(+)